MSGAHYILLGFLLLGITAGVLLIVITEQRFRAELYDETFILYRECLRYHFYQGDVPTDPRDLDSEMYELIGNYHIAYFRKDGTPVPEEYSVDICRRVYDAEKFDWFETLLLGFNKWQEIERSNNNGEN